MADGDGDGALGGHHVAAGEDARVPGHQVGPDLDHAVGEGHAGHVLQHGQVGVLAQRQHQAVRLELFELSGRPKRWRCAARR
jgi:hypothetical protein